MNTQYLSPGESEAERSRVGTDRHRRTETTYETTPRCCLFDEIVQTFCQHTKFRHTFKECKLPIFPFKSGSDVTGQSPPKVTNRHGISIHNMVVTYPPEPFILKEKKIFTNSLLDMSKGHIKSPTRFGGFTLNTNISPLRMAMVSKCPSQMLGPK